jgi:hypothetical protein
MRRESTVMKPDSEPPATAPKFTEPQMQKYYEASFDETDNASDERCQVRGLMAVHDLSHMLEGPHSLGVHEAIGLLLSLKLRPELREWYQRSGTAGNSKAIVLRDRLSEMAGEKL